jgi:hypothetical protein
MVVMTIDMGMYLGGLGKLLSGFQDRPMESRSGGYALEGDGALASKLVCVRLGEP